MKKTRTIIYFIIGSILTLVSIWQIALSQSGLKIINLPNTDPPVTIISPSNASPNSHPTILIAHGFSGSSVLMRGFALTLAHAGYTTVSWDFRGHGLNPDPLTTSTSGDLIVDAESALSVATTTGMIDTKKIAILGHSMGSGVAITYGMAHPDSAATIAVSPVNQSVTPSLPRNLLLMAGSLEARFLATAQKLLVMAGGESDDFSSGTARNLVTIPGVEHISILFSPYAHSVTRSWLDEAFGSQQGRTDYTDHRILWFGLGIFGIILLGNAGISLIHDSRQQKPNLDPLWKRLLSIFTGGILATLTIWLLTVSGVKTNQSFGLLVGGYIILWFGFSGLISLIILRPEINKPTAQEIIKGLLVFAILWLGVGLLGSFVWLPWLLIQSRLLLWLPALILIAPWFFSVGSATRGAKPIAQIGWWFFQSLTVVFSLFLAIRLSPQLGFILILLPLIPLIIGIHMLIISSRHGVWAYTLSGAMFTAWLILAVFPLQ
jgi:pimeloyl-ACP methyl ester carboxylesterase